MIGPVRRGEQGAWFNSRWYPELDVLDDDEREMPETVPDEEAYDHRFGCMCRACRRPEARHYKRARVRRGSGRPLAPRGPRP